MAMVANTYRWGIIRQVVVPLPPESVPPAPVSGTARFWGYGSSSYIYYFATGHGRGSLHMSHVRDLGLPPIGEVPVPPVLGVTGDAARAREPSSGTGAQQWHSSADVSARRDSASGTSPHREAGSPW